MAELCESAFRQVPRYSSRSDGRFRNHRGAAVGRVLPDANSLVKKTILLGQVMRDVAVYCLEIP